MTNLIDHAALISALGGAAQVSDGFDAVGSELRAPAVSVRAWAARNRIPPEYWPGMITFAETKKLVVTADWLMKTTPARKNASSLSEAAAA